jgi:RNA polymerase sigma-70 factor (ECF subfamily)
MPIHPDQTSEQQPDDRALLRAHVAGDDEAFGILFARHRDRLWAVALRTTGDPEEAADALQDAMIAAFRRADTFRGDAAVTTWLHRVVVNACLDRLRRRSVRRAEPLPDDLDDARATTAGSGLLGGGQAGEVVDPAVLAVDHERRRAVLAALDTLPVDQRAALVLVDMEGYSVEETASILECAPGTVKSRCSRGRARLLPLLTEHAPASRGAGAARADAPENRATTTPRNPRDGPRVGPEGTAETGSSVDAGEEVTSGDA